MRSMIVRQILCLGLGSLTVIFAAGLQQVESKEIGPYCVRGSLGSPGGGLLECSYFSVRQCMATVGAGAEGCQPNPELAWRALERQRNSSRGVVPSDRHRG